ncbi:odorant receptor 22c-like [Microplitis mediator]|uniref:odorant receptor 22c-like n=1 Tax=Microplitis mediator TaxID=375433 RepID=UPI0025537DF2|nr:odorant receptor 22c-like [Microplitis mediator]
MDIFEEPFYKMIKNSSHVIGQWPYQSSRQKFTIVTLIWIAFFMQFIPQIIAIVIHLDDRNVLFEAFSSMVIDIAFIVKYFNAIYRAGLMKELWDSIRCDWTLLLNDVEKRTLQHHVNLGNFFSIGYAGLAYMSTTIFVIEPIFPRIVNIFVETNETVPLKLALPLEYIIININKHYWTMLTITNIFVFNIIVVIISCDIVLITFVQHVCGLFAVVGCRLESTPFDENYSKGRKGEDYLSNSNDIAYEHLESCIKGHKRALEYAERLESAYTLSNGILSGMNAPVMSITGYLMITELSTIEQLLKYATFAISQMSHLFFLCFMSQQLADMSLRIQENIGNATWYNNSIKSQKLLILMLRRSQVPCKLTAAKLMDLSIENFALVVKTSASYITMLLSM